MHESAADPLAFTLVPSRARHDGWTAHRQRDFIAALARIGIVSAAAKSAGMSPKSAYALRTRAGEDHAFARAWSAAIERGRRNALDTGIQNALHSAAVPVSIAAVRSASGVGFNDSLLIAALRATDPRFHRVAAGPDAEWDL